MRPSVRLPNWATTIRYLADAILSDLVAFIVVVMPLKFYDFLKLPRLSTVFVSL